MWSPSTTLLVASLMALTRTAAGQGTESPPLPGPLDPLPPNAPVPVSAADLVADDPELAPLPESPAASEEAAAITGSTCSDSGGKNDNIVAGNEDYAYGTSFSYTVRQSEGSSCNVQMVSIM